MRAPVATRKCRLIHPRDSDTLAAGGSGSLVWFLVVYCLVPRAANVQIPAAFTSAMEEGDVKRKLLSHTRIFRSLTKLWLVLVVGLVRRLPVPG